MGSVLDGIGGEEAVVAVVDRLYKAVWDDAVLAEYFVDEDGEKLRERQGAFVAAALGGAGCAQRDLRSLPDGRPVDPDAFDRVLGHLAHAMATSAIPTPVIEKVVRAVAPLRAELAQDAQPAVYAEAVPA